MTYRQPNIAFDLCFGNPDKGEATVAALGHYIEAMRVFERALADFRDELLKNMDAHYPRAAKRIGEGKPPRSRRKPGSGSVWSWRTLTGHGKLVSAMPYFRS
jgi:hypothetical protein